MWAAGLSLLWFLGGFWTELRRFFWVRIVVWLFPGFAWGLGWGRFCGLRAGGGGVLVVSVFVAVGPRGAGGSAAAGWPGCCGTPCKTQTRNEDDL